MAVVGNFYFCIFLRLTREFLGLESECGGSVCWPSNKIIDSERDVKKIVVNFTFAEEKKCAVHRRHHFKRGGRETNQDMLRPGTTNKIAAFQTWLEYFAS